MEMVVRSGDSTASIEIHEDDTVLSALQRGGFAVDAPCGGAGTCGKCLMLISDAFGTSYRLACQTAASSDTEVVVEQNKTMAVSLGSVLSACSAHGEPGTYGLTFDIGTTTVVARLCDLATGAAVAAVGAPNPQIAFGADVISRISACEDGKLEAMERLIGDKLVTLSLELISQARVDVRSITGAVIAGNTTMLHIAAGLDPSSIGAAPFKPLSLFGEVSTFEPFRRAGIAQGRALFSPCIAGYVGGDIACGLVACGVARSDAPMLLLDLGTNGEMALGSKRGIVACATAAGPVFEGANIKYGMPAYAGAVSEVRFDPVARDIAVSVIGEGDAVGICGTGLIDAVALLLEFGLIDETGRLAGACEIDDAVEITGMEVPAPLAKRLVTEDGAPAFRVVDGIVLTQKDVRSLQLAKAAVCAGIETMLEDACLQPADIASVVIAGGFGEHLSLSGAVRIGLFPAELKDRATCAGNTAIEGAAELFSDCGRKACREVIEKTRYIELSGDKVFNERYIEDMMFDEP